jgi:hypothetical protein
MILIIPLPKIMNRKVKPQLYIMAKREKGNALAKKKYMIISATQTKTSIKELRISLLSDIYLFNEYMFPTAKTTKSARAA